MSASTVTRSTPLDLGDVAITEVFDPSFRDDQHVASVRIEAQDGDEAISAGDDPGCRGGAARGRSGRSHFLSVESVGPKVSGELIHDRDLVRARRDGGGAGLYLAPVRMAVRASARWRRWCMTCSSPSVSSRSSRSSFDLAIIAALLTIVGYSLNDTVVVFDRVRENLRRFKKLDLKEVLNLSINETMSRTVMTSGTTLLALIALLVLGGDVIRGFVFAMTLRHCHRHLLVDLRGLRSSLQARGQTRLVEARR